MVQYLREPNTNKNSSLSSNQTICIGSSCMQGWRSTMEDRHVMFTSLPGDPSVDFFGVYDGHGGSHVSNFLAENLHEFIVNDDDYKNNIERALKSAMLEIDRIMQDYIESAQGSTAVVVLIKDNRLYCANVGDSRAVFCMNGKAGALSVDHKPYVDTEKRRIYAAGGYVAKRRVMGYLGLSRAFGDYSLKDNPDLSAEEQMVTALPDIKVFDINEEWEFCILACDGIWDVMSTKQVVYFCRARIAMGLMPDKICEDLMNECISCTDPTHPPSRDNMTVILVCFLHNQPYEALVKRCGSCVGIQTAEEPTRSNSLSAIVRFAQRKRKAVDEQRSQEENSGTIDDKLPAKVPHNDDK